MRDTELRDFLLGLSRGETGIPPEGRAGFLMDHLDALGSPDPETRDRLFYETADAWIRDGALRDTEMAALFDRLVSADFLFLGLGGDGVAQGTRPALRRSFSILLVDSLLSGKAAPAFLALRPRKAVLGAVLRYVELETDLEGLLAVEGWVHAVAHSSDALATLALSPECTGAELEAILGGAARLLLKSPVAYAWQEDKRVARILQALYERDPAAAPRILAFVDGLAAACPESFTDPVAYARRLNVLNLVRALYFQVRLVDEERRSAARDSGGGGETLARGLEERARALQKVRTLSI